ncbi:MAG TPA: hypothetical protein VGM90_25835 [Kofleriaceae bacterium]|jgi:hypothetical protein
MRLGFALACALPVITSGCSLIYNPNNIDKPDPDALQAIDAEIVVDANPAGLSIASVASPVIYEGQGVDGAARAVVVVVGDNMEPDAKIQIVDHTTQLAVASLTVADAETEVAGNHKMIAVPVTVALDANDSDIQLDVWVTQNVDGSPLTVKLANGADGASPALILRGLPVVDGAAAVETIDTGAITGGAPAVFEKVYAKFNAKTLTVTGKNPLRIRSISSFALADKIDISATGLTMPGVGGNLGGGAGPTSGAAPNGAGPCGGPGGAAQTAGSVATAGAGGGLGTAGTGGTCTVADPNLSSLVKNLGGGGGGGGGTPGFLTLGAAMGGAGGASGGTIQIDAGSTLTLTGGVTSNGVAGTGGGNSNAQAGGAGSGGAILLRARGMLSAGTVVASGGVATAGSGRIRYDSAVPAATIAPTPADAYRGPAIESLAEIIKTPLPTLKVYGAPGAPVKITIDGFQNDGSSAHKNVPIELGDDGTNSVNLGAGQNLFRGVNTVCAVVDGVTAVPAPDEARDCVTVVYMFQNGQ